MLFLFREGLFFLLAFVTNAVRRMSKLEDAYALTKRFVRNENRVHETGMFLEQMYFRGVENII